MESFSDSLLRVIDYELDENLRMTVHSDSSDYYRYIDATVLTEIFYEFARETITTELPAEVHHLQRHDACREQMRAIIDFPERHAELFIKLCLQNGGKLAKRKRQLPEFDDLTDEELHALEAVIVKCFPEVG